MAWPDEAGAIAFTAPPPYRRRRVWLPPHPSTPAYDTPVVATSGMPPFMRRRLLIPPIAVQAGTFRAKYYGELRGLYRIFNAAEYRFYRSNSAPPVESDEPFDTNPTLPHTPTDTYSTGTWYVSVSYFNGVHDSGFLPMNVNGETYIRLNIATGGAAPTYTPPRGPL